MWAPTCGKWIWLEGEERPANGYAQFRKAFTLDRVPSKAVVHVSGDCKYILFVNGEIVGRGPITSDPRYKQVDIYDVAGYLRVGENALAALVLYRHAKTSRLWPVRGGFLAEFCSPGVCFGTDGTWKGRWAVEYKSDAPFMTHQYGHQEWLDARKGEPGWQLFDFDDRGWKNTLVVAEAGKYWPEALEIRTVPHMRRDIRHPVRLVGFFSSGGNGRGPENYYEPAKQIQVSYMGSSVLVWNEEGICDPGCGPVVFQENSSDGLGFVVDLGEEMFGYPFIEFEAPEGVVVDLGHGEVLGRNHVITVLLPESNSEQRYGDRYYSRGGRQRWEIFDTKGCRYLEVHFRNIPPDGEGRKRVTIHRVGFIRSQAPAQRETEFSCSDKLLNRIFEICRRTMEVKNQEWHICDINREQNIWIEPFQEMVHLQIFGKLEMHVKTLQAFARGQLADGFFPSTIPSIYEGEQRGENQYLMSSVVYPLVVYLDRLYGGADSRHAEMLAACERFFEAIGKYIDKDNILRNTPGSHWCEWSGIDTRPSDVNMNVKESWEVTYMTGHLILSLECAAWLAEELGRLELAQRWRDRAEGLRRSAISRYWSEERQAYLDGIYDGRRSDSVSQTTNAMAILARLGNEARLKTIAQTITNPKSYDVPSQVNQTTYLNEALVTLNMDEEVPGTIRRLYKKMLDQGATTTWESEFALERSCGCCFGFAAHPLWYMVHNYLGVIPLEEGYKTFSVRIRPHDLEYAAGKIATPRGFIEVSWRKTGSGLLLELTVPEGCTATIGLPQEGEVNAVKSIQVNGQTAALTSQRIAISTYIQKMAPGCKVEAGRYRVEFL